MTAIRSSTVDVPGATIYYELCGSGPTILVISGGAGGAGCFDFYREYLVNEFKILTYDRRGSRRSPVEDSNEPIEITTHSDDVRRLLLALGHEPVFVLGFSIGGIIGLDLTIRYPSQVRTLIAHEPAVCKLFPGIKRPKEGLMGLYRREGAAMALKIFGSNLGVPHNYRESNLGLPSDRIDEFNKEFFFKCDVPALQRYTLDVVAVKFCPTRIVLAGGTDGREYSPYKCTARLAECTGKDMVDFPGNHGGSPFAARAFAERLHEILRN